MELRQLRHFVSLAEERSFTRAASRERIVQSGLSSSVRALENELGVLLFVRGTRPVRLTSEGEALLPAARRTLDAAENATRTVQETTGVLSGRLRIGTLRSAGHTLPVTSWLADFAVAHPGVSLHVRQFSALKTLAMVGAGELDCAIVSVVPERTAGLEVVPLLSEPIVLACAPGHPLARRPSVSLPELRDERFVGAHPDWAITVLIEGAFRAAGIGRSIVAEADEWSMVLDLVAAGVGIALVPAGLDFAPNRDRGAIEPVPLTGVTLERRIDFVLPQGHAAAPAAKRMRELIRTRQAR